MLILNFKFNMKYWVVACCIFLLNNHSALAQIDINNLNIGDLLGKVIKVEKGFEPKFYIGNIKIPKIKKVAEILGVKDIPEVNSLFKTYKTGRTVYKIAAYAGSAIAVYGVIKSLDKAALKQDYQAAIISGISSVASGVIVKLLTKGASYKAVDIFNNTVKNKIKDIFHIGAATQTIGVGVYVRL